LLCFSSLKYKVYSVADFNVESDALGNSWNYSYFEEDCEFCKNNGEDNIVFTLTDGRNKTKEFFYTWQYQKTQDGKEVNLSTNNNNLSDSAISMNSRFYTDQNRTKLATGSYSCI